LVSSKYITPFSDFRWEDASCSHPPIEEYLDYLGRYVAQFNLEPYLYFGLRVDSVLRTSSNHYTIRCTYKKFASKKLQSKSFNAVAICSGLHNIPFTPIVKGIEHFKGISIHSSEYKERSIFRRKRVLIVGCGETGCDIAYRAVQESQPRGVCMCVRRGFLSVPTALNERVPLDTYITNLFECAYQHRWTETLKLKWTFTTPFIRLAFLLGTGSSGGFNQWDGTLPNVKRGYHIINKSTAIMPYINPQIKRNSWFGRNLYHFFDRHNMYPETRVVKIVPSIERFSDDGTSVVFTDGNIENFDIVVWCTGYRQKFPFLPERSASLGGQDEALPSEHMVCSPGELTLAYIGFVRPNVGAIPPMSEMQVFYWIHRLRGNLPSGAPTTYKLLGLERTRAYGVDYGAYMHDLAREVGIAPSLGYWIFHNPRVAVAYAMGQSYITFFRLEGPFKDSKAVKISGNELLRPVLDRGLAGNLLFVLIIIFFGILNTAFWFVEHLFVRPMQSLWKKIIVCSSS